MIIKIILGIACCLIAFFLTCFIWDFMAMKENNRLRNTKAVQMGYKAGEVLKELNVKLVFL